jgi:hypothetical protein
LRYALGPLSIRLHWSLRHPSLAQALNDAGALRLEGRIVVCVHELSHILNEIWIAFTQLHRNLFGLLIITGSPICSCEVAEGRVVPRGGHHRLLALFDRLFPLGQTGLKFLQNL